MTEQPFDALGRVLRAAAERQVSATAVIDRPQPRRRWRSLLVAVVVGLPVSAAAAWAASSLLDSGSPVAYPDGPPVTGRGLGTVVPGTAKLLIADVADPRGGLPWGLRSFTTTRGFVCLQVGRVQDGRLGVVGRDGAFGNDGRFHELRPGVVLDENRCFPPDGAGRAFLTVHQARWHVSGDQSRCGGVMQRPQGACADARSRSVDYGLLGPRATQVTARLDGRTRTLSTVGSQGAYLVVGKVQQPPPPTASERRLQRGLPVGRARPDGYVVAMTPASPVITAVRYGHDGTCTVDRQDLFTTGDSRGSCPDPPGFVPIPQPSAQAVRARVTARPHGQRSIRVSFTAPVAVPDRLSGYAVLIYPPHGPSSLIGDTTDADIPAGRRVIKDIDLPQRPSGLYRAVVRYRTQSPHPGPRGNLQSPGALVGTDTVRIP